MNTPCSDVPCAEVVPSAYLKMRADFVDRPLAALLLLVFSPILLIVGIAVAAFEGFPVLVALERVGIDRSMFYQKKFRSMTVETGGSQITAGGDLRVTPLGEKLRSCRLDELPQLLNILRGEMSLIGPRPENADMVDDRSEWSDVLQVRPGLAGVTQLVFSQLEPKLLRGPDPESTYRYVVLPAKLSVDRWYISTASPLLDLQILAATLRAISGRPPPAALLGRLPDLSGLLRE